MVCSLSAFKSEQLITDNIRSTELSFPEDAQVTNLEFPDDDWWFGHYRGDSGLFPANYVQLNQ